MLRFKINPKFCHLLFFIWISFAIDTSFAKEITILYTGETHAMLYPCNCPVEPDGGIARRTTLIRQLKKDNPQVLLLDSGGFFAGGLMDEYTQNTELDRQRSRINLKAMELMKYDAVAVGDDEFNFGREFLEENIEKTNLVFLSCNIQFNKVLPYMIKEVSGIKIGIIGLTTMAAKQKAGGTKFAEPNILVKQTIEELKKKGINLIVLLSHLGESEDLRLIEEVKDIDILIMGHSRAKEEPPTKIASTLVLRPSWQGRRLDKLTFTVKDNKIINYKVDQLRLSDKIRDDPEMLSVLPPCFSDTNCKKKGMIGTCLNGGSLNSRCVFSEPTKISLIIITSKLCKVCETQRLTNYLKAQFPGLSVSYLYYPDAKANEWIKDFEIKGLPAYLLTKEAEKEKGFANLKENLEIKGNFYMLKPQFGSIGYFLNRQNLKGKLDLFISLYDKDTAQLLDAIEYFHPAIHFLAEQQQNTFYAARGGLEVEEYLRSVCIQKHYPEYFWNYISCRAKFINSSWWEDCLGNLDTYKIKTCAKSEEGKGLLRENTQLGKELEVMFGPTYLLDNQELFGIEGVPTKESLKKIFKR